MTETSIQVTPSSMALSSENYQTFEMAKANDSILGSDDIAQIRSYAAYARAQAQAIHKTIAATNGIDDVAAIKAEATETAQTFAKVGIYADQRIGEILRGIEQAKRGPKVNSDTQEKTKADAIKDAGIPKSQAYDLQAMAANPEVVEAVIAKATEEGRVVSRKQVLDAIAEKKRAEQQRDEARQEMQDVYLQAENMELEVERLKDQLKSRPQHEVVREVVPDDYEELKRNVKALRHEAEMLNDSYQQVWREKLELDKKLAQANELLGERGKDRDVQRDVEYLTARINTLLHDHGGKVWAFDQLYRVDETTRHEFERAMVNLAAFAQNMTQMIAENQVKGELA